MPFTVLNTVLENPVQNGTELVFEYPKGKVRSRYMGASLHSVSFGGAFFRAPKDFSVLFTDTNIHVVWHGGQEIPAGRILTVQLDEPLSGAHVDERTGQIIPNMVRSQMFIIDLGRPRPVEVDALLKQGNFASQTKQAVVTDPALRPLRNITATVHGALEGERAIRIRGFDYYNRPMTEEIALQADGTGVGKKCFRHVLEAEVNAPVNSPISIGVGDKLGLPTALPGSGFVLRYFVNGKGLTGGVIVPAYEDGFPTAFTPDLRGYFTPPEDVAIDGKNHFKMLVSLFNPFNIGVNEYYDFDFDSSDLPELAIELNPAKQLGAPAMDAEGETKLVDIIPAPARH